MQNPELRELPRPSPSINTPTRIRNVRMSTPKLSGSSKASLGTSPPRLICQHVEVNTSDSLTKADGVFLLESRANENDRVNPSLPGKVKLEDERNPTNFDPSISSVRMQEYQRTVSSVDLTTGGGTKIQHEHAFEALHRSEEERKTISGYKTSVGHSMDLEDHSLRLRNSKYMAEDKEPCVSSIVELIARETNRMVPDDKDELHRVSSFFVDDASMSTRGYSSDTHPSASALSLLPGVQRHQTLPVRPLYPISCELKNSHYPKSSSEELIQQTRDWSNTNTTMHKQ